MRISHQRLRNPGVVLGGRILCLALFSLFLLQNAFAEQPRDSREASAQTITHLQDLPTGTVQPTSSRSEGRAQHVDVIVVGPLVSDVTALHVIALSKSSQASPPLASLLTYSQYVTSQL
jgi:hypothetical protein